MKEFIYITIMILCLLIAPTGFAQTSDLPAEKRNANIALQRLEMELRRAEKISGGTVGVSALHLESGRRIGMNSGERFPMASTYKLPIAVQLLTRVDQGEISLDRIVEIKESDYRAGGGILTDLLNKPGVMLSVRNLLELMILISDNTAADLLLYHAGGPEAVTTRMRALGIEAMDINRPTVSLLADSAGYGLPPEKEWNPGLFRKLYGETTPESRREAAQKFVMDLRDTATPEAMVKLLERIYRGGVLKKDNQALLIDTLERCKTGGVRMKGFLFPETTVAHKTGTLTGITNDAGVITLPHEAGQVAIAVFVKSSEKEIREREQAIAHIARAVHDYFLFQLPNSAEEKK